MTKNPPPILRRDQQPFRRSQTAVQRWPGNSDDGFHVELRRQRERANLSQTKLAGLAGLTHSYVSRLETDNRNQRRQPTRDAVLFLAEALNASPRARDLLLSRAGFMPVDVCSLLEHMPVLAEAYAVLSSGEIPDVVREDVNAAIRMALRQARRAVVGMEVAS